MVRWLAADLASYLDARAAGGRWLLRMEDLDPPREMPGAQTGILQALEAYGFEWDGHMVRQSERLDIYNAQIERLVQEGELIVVPRGVEHLPVAETEETWIMMFEPAGTLNTGNVTSERTVAVLEKL